VEPELSAVLSLTREVVSRELRSSLTMYSLYSPSRLPAHALAQEARVTEESEEATSLLPSEF